MRERERSQPHLAPPSQSNQYIMHINIIRNNVNKKGNQKSKPGCQSRFFSRLRSLTLQSKRQHLDTSLNIRSTNSVLSHSSSRTYADKIWLCILQRYSILPTESCQNILSLFKHPYRCIEYLSSPENRFEAGSRVEIILQRMELFLAMVQGHRCQNPSHCLCIYVKLLGQDGIFCDQF